MPWLVAEAGRVAHMFLMDPERGGIRTMCGLPAADEAGVIRWRTVPGEARCVVCEELANRGPTVT
jgi:hypothetical protein